jgi:hypothetical protein
MAATRTETPSISIGTTSFDNRLLSLIYTSDDI